MKLRCVLKDNEVIKEGVKVDKKHHIFMKNSEITVCFEGYFGDEKIYFFRRCGYYSYFLLNNDHFTQLARISKVFLKKVMSVQR